MLVCDHAIGSDCLGSAGHQVFSAWPIGAGSQNFAAHRLGTPSITCVASAFYDNLDRQYGGTPASTVDKFRCPYRHYTSHGNLDLERVESEGPERHPSARKSTGARSTISPPSPPTLQRRLQRKLGGSAGATWMAMSSGPLTGHAEGPVAGLVESMPSEATGSTAIPRRTF